MLPFKKFGRCMFVASVAAACTNPLYRVSKCDGFFFFFFFSFSLSNSHTLQTQPYCFAQHGIGLPAQDSVAQHCPSADKKQDLKYGLF